MVEHTHEQVDFEAVSAYLDGELDADSAAKVARHLANHPAWRDAYEALRRMDASLEALPAGQPPAGLVEGILAACEQSQRRRWVWRVAGSLAGAAAAAAIVVAIVLNSPIPTKAPTLADNQGDTDSAGQVELPAQENEDLPAVARTTASDDQVIVENLGFFQDFDVIENYRTLQAIERLESGSLGT